MTILVERFLRRFSRNSSDEQNTAESILPETPGTNSARRQTTPGLPSPENMPMTRLSIQSVNSNAPARVSE